MNNKTTFPVSWPFILALIAYVCIGVWLEPGILNNGFRFDESFSEYIPWRVEAGRLLASGEFPFFTQRVFGGMPLFPTSYSGVLYPPNWLYIFSPPWIANYLNVFHYALGGIGMYLYLRTWRLIPFCAFIGGLLFITNTFMLSHSSHVSMREAALFAPIVVWTARLLLKSPSFPRALLLSLLIALQISIGYQQLYLFTVLWIGVEWLALFKFNRKFLKKTLLLALAGVAGTALLGIQILTALEHVQYTPRAEMTVEVWQEASFPPNHILIHLNPRVFGFGWPDYMGDSFAAEIVVTVSLMAWALCVAYIVFCLLKKFKVARKRITILLLVCIPVIFLLALGKYFPLNKYLFHVPPFNLFRVPSRWLFLMGTFVVILSSFSLQHIMRMKPLNRLAWTFGALVVWHGVIVLLYYLLRSLPEGSRAGSISPWEHLYIGSEVNLHRVVHWLHGPYASGPIQILDYTGIHLLLPALAILPLAFARRFPLPAAGLIVFLLSFNQMILFRYALFESYPAKEFTTLEGHKIMKDYDFDLVERLYMLSPDGASMPDGAYPHMLYLYPGFSSLSGYCPLVSSRLWDTLRINQLGFPVESEMFYKSAGPLRQLGVSHIFVDETRLSPKFEELYQNSMGSEFEKVLENEGTVLLKVIEPRPRFDYATEWRQEDAAEYNTFVREHDPRPGNVLAILHKPDWDRLPPPESSIAPATIEVLEDSATRQELRVSSEEGAVLLIRDVWWKGWKFKIPDVTEGWDRVHRANGLIRYVAVPPGEHIVTLRYRPPGWHTGLLISAIGLMLMAGMLAGAWFERKLKLEK